MEDTARDVAARTVAAAAAEEAIGPLREEAQVAGAVLHRLAIENDRLEREAAQAAAQVERLATERLRVAADRERELHIVDDAKAALERLNAELALVGQQAKDAPERLPALIEASRAADAVRAAAEAEVERLAGELAAQDAERRAAEARVAEAQTRLGRNARALEQAKADRAALGDAIDPRAAEAQARFDAALAALREARETLTQAETDLAAGAAAAEARKAMRETEDQLGRLKTEARGLAQLTAPPPRPPSPRRWIRSRRRRATRPPWPRPWAMT